MTRKLIWAAGGRDRVRAINCFLKVFKLSSFTFICQQCVGQEPVKTFSMAHLAAQRRLSDMWAILWWFLIAELKRQIILRHVRVANFLNPLKFWLLAMAIGTLGISLESFACSCAFVENSPFIHDGHLPSNARGVLFRAGLNVNARIGNVDDDIEIVKGIPKPLDENSFSITEDESHAVMKVEVKRLHAVDQIDGSWPMHYYRFLSARLEKCYENRYSNHRPSGCNMYDFGNLKVESIEKHVATGKMQDVTTKFESALGLFRIGPRSGFEAGKTYTIKYVTKDVYGPHGTEVNLGFPMPQLTVSIDGPMVLSKQDSFILVPESRPTKQQLRVEWGGGSCSNVSPSLVQNLRYQIPNSYRPYIQSMMFFTHKKVSESDGVWFHEKIGEFSISFYRSSVCSQFRYGQSELGAGKELIYSPCDTHKKTGAARQVRGYVGFLELEDNLHETPVIEINFDDKKGDLCENTGANRPIAN